MVLVLAILATACGGDEHPPAPSADASANLQVRRVENVVIRSSPEWDATELTCPGEDAGACLAATGAESVVVMDADEVKYLLGPVVVDGGDVEEAKAYEDPVNEGWTVSTPLSPEGSEALASATRGAVRALPPKDHIAIVADGLVVSGPTVAQPVTAGIMIVSVGLSQAEAERLASRLNGGD